MSGPKIFAACCIKRGIWSSGKHVWERRRRGDDGASGGQSMGREVKQFVPRDEGRSNRTPRRKDEKGGASVPHIALRTVSVVPRSLHAHQGPGQSQSRGSPCTLSGQHASWVHGRGPSGTVASGALRRCRSRASSPFSRAAACARTLESLMTGP